MSEKSIYTIELDARKIQEENKELRGSKCEERHNKEDKIVNDLKGMN